MKQKVEKEEARREQRIRDKMRGGGKLLAKVTAPRNMFLNSFTIHALSYTNVTIFGELVYSGRVNQDAADLGICRVHHCSMHMQFS